MIKARGLLGPGHCDSYWLAGTKSESKVCVREEKNNLEKGTVLKHKRGEFEFCGEPRQKIPKEFGTLLCLVTLNGHHTLKHQIQSLLRENR